jgi:DHA1 family bicyclomycin/chloramphenicol resistance-like MFS transporter
MRPWVHGQRLPVWLPLLLGILQAVGPISIDMYLPAFPAIEADFHAAPGSAQITLATWILGLSCGQMLNGTLVDRFGRRTPLLLGTAAYALACAGCAMSTSIAMLAIWRFIAAIGGSASMVVPRAVVRDVSEGHAAARLMSRLILVLGAAPILAPSLGGLVLQVANWRVIFWITATYGTLCLLLATLFLPDTLPIARRIVLHPTTMLARYIHIATERNFITHTLMLAGGSFSLFAYLGGSPTTFIVYYHLSPGRFAILFGGIAATYVLFSQLNVLVTGRLGLDRTLRIMSSLFLALSLLLLAIQLAGGASPLALAVVLALTQGMNGFISPTGTVGGLANHAVHAGTASALMLTLQFLIGGSSGFLIAWLTDGTPLPMLELMLAGAIVTKVADLCRPRRASDRPARAYGDGNPV